MNTLIDSTKMFRKFFEIAVEETHNLEDLTGNFNFAMSMVEKYLIELNSDERFKCLDTNKIMETCELVFRHIITDDFLHVVYCEELYEEIADILDCNDDDVKEIIENIWYDDEDDYSDSDDEDEDDDNE